MRFWYHLGAAVVGLMLAAALVTVAFREADESGSAQSGTAPPALRAQGGSSSGANPDCGGKSPAMSRKQASVTQAETALPQIFDAKNVEVEVRAPNQRRWFARVQSYSGTCVDEITVSERQLVIAATFAEKVTPANRDAYLFGTLEAAFQPPLARRVLQVSWVDSSNEGSILIRSGAWTQFRQSRGALGIPNTLDGLQQYGRRVGLTAQELRVQCPALADHVGSSNGFSLRENQGQDKRFR